MTKANIVLLTILTFLAITGLPGKGNAEKVFGCYDKEHAKLRVVSDNYECLKFEETIPLIEAINEVEEHCFKVGMQDGTMLGIAKFGLSHIVDGHYSVTGKTYYDNSQIIRGNAEIYGNNILLTATHTSKGDTNLSIGKSHILLDRTTLNGISKVVIHNLNYSNMSIKRDYRTAFLTNIPCPN